MMTLLLLVLFALPVRAESTTEIGLAAGNRLTLGKDGRDPSRFSLVLTERVRSGKLMERHHNLEVLQAAYSGMAVPSKDLGPLRFLRSEKGVFWFTDDCGGVWREDMPAKGGEARIRPVHVGYVFNGPECALIKNEQELDAALKKTLPALPGEQSLSAKEVLKLSTPLEELRERVQKSALPAAKKEALHEKARIPPEVPAPNPYPEH